MQYHPSQQIKKEHEDLFSRAILESLAQPQMMLGDLPESASFHLPTSANSDSIFTKLPRLRFDQKLGHLYEDALFLLLSSLEQFHCLARNLQIITPEKRTLGELDFILWDKVSEKLIHLELAVKFYLIHHNGNTTCYPGPDARDNYHRKLKRLREHQLRLCQIPDTLTTLSNITEAKEITVNHMVHGIFFDYIAAKNQPSPELANSLSRRRTWLYSADLPHYLPDLKSVRVLPKQLWLCDIDEHLYSALVEVSIPELLQLAHQRCTMFVSSPSDSPKFLVPNYWPGSSLTTTG